MYVYYISETCNWLKEYLKDKIELQDYLSNIPKDEKNIIVFTVLTYYENIVPKISISTKYDIFDHRFPNAQFNNHKCITIFLHCNIKNIKEDIEIISKKYLQYPELLKNLELQN